MSFEVLKPGVLSLIQDFGRYGWQQLGYTQGGPMDEHAFLWANRLLGNRPDAPQIEITYGGLELRVIGRTMAAVTGADLNATLNGEPLQHWFSFPLQTGDRLFFSHPRNGLRAYLAVRGGLTIPVTMGSCATVMRERVGGLDGKGGKLQQGDTLPWYEQERSRPQGVPWRFVPDYTATLTMRLIAGYQHRHFPPKALHRLYSESYRVSQKIDRMGYCLSGAPIECPLDGIVSEGISYGAVQIPSDGQPIVLLKDRQTIGGYPKLGCIAALDAGKLAQRMSGATVRFTPARLPEVTAERLRFYKFFGVTC
ncbi:MAG: biotin-dependent carboxyltransferase family protein [Gammaproteobacteria bacterium]|nr:biotin-dependent carboxyltransferase family protein [Gammaproteobacteria bacterium]MCB1849795.1 biotin-dependent carboxyltransferase family protein [Gammaproteobacteria bacterium]MCP5418392.1 biotin-dependent carboxyltransferase family protein [Chromatiaceae bacterium]